MVYKKYCIHNVLKKNISKKKRLNKTDIFFIANLVLIKIKQVFIKASIF